MSKTKAVLIYALGMAVGALTATIYAKGYYSRKADEDIYEMRKHYIDKMKRSYHGDDKDKVISDFVVETEHLVAPKNEAGKVDYTKFYESDGRNTLKMDLENTSELAGDADFDEHMAERESPEEEDDGLPRVISQAKADELERTCDIVELKYFKKDGVFLEEGEDSPFDFNDYSTPEIEKALATSKHNNYIQVYAPEVECVFTIATLNKAYATEYLGVEEYDE